MAERRVFGERFLEDVSAIVLAIIFVAVISVLVSKSSKTVEFIKALGQFFTSVFGTILKPISQ